MKREAETFRNFNLDVVPSIVEEAFAAIQADPETFDTMDNGFEYYAEDLVVASGRVEDYADALGIDQDDPEWQEAVRDGWDWDYIEDVGREVDDKLAEVVERADLPGGLSLGSNEGSGDYGLIYYIDYDEAEAAGVQIPAEPARHSW